MVSGAGVAINFTLAAGLALLARGLVWYDVLPQTQFAQMLWAMMGTAIFLNFGLAVFNLLPIPPLDGSHILRNLLPGRAALRFTELSRYGGLLLLVVVVVSQTVPFLAWPIIRLMLGFAGTDAASVIVYCMDKFHMLG
jgi:Zn-dependent protease